MVVPVVHHGFHFPTNSGFCGANVPFGRLNTRPKAGISAGIPGRKTPQRLAA